MTALRIPRGIADARLRRSLASMLFAALAVACGGEFGAPEDESFENAWTEAGEISPSLSLKASPNPCVNTTGGRCVTTVSLQIPDRSFTYPVFVSENGGTPKLHKCMRDSGSWQVSWISIGHTYEFTTYQTRSQCSSVPPAGAPDASVLVTGTDESSALQVNPKICVVAEGSNTCSVRLTPRFDKADSARHQIFVSVDGGPLKSMKCESVPASFEISWIQRGHSYDFLLYTSRAPCAATPTGALVAEVRGITGSSSGQSTEPADPELPSQPVGPALQPFWSAQPVLGPYLEAGVGLIDIPSYLETGDFPYQKRPVAQEVPFADHLTVVRLLGGHSAKDGSPQPELDLVYRKSDGSLGYRMDLLWQRLQPYLDAGYADSLTLVLDDVPWALTSNPVEGPYGQVGPPDSAREWGDFIGAIARELRDALGAQTANRLRFRIGTETNRSLRFEGTEQQYFDHYDHAAAAIGAVLPWAKVGPGNVAGASIVGIDTVHNMSVFELAEHTVGEPNARTSAVGTRFDFFAFSRYMAVGEDTDNRNGELARICSELGRRSPALAKTGCEIHEFGIQPWLGNQDFLSAEPGPWGGAQILHSLIRYYDSGFDRIWHWPVADVYRDHQNVLRHLITAQGWAYSVLEHMRDGQTVTVQASSDLSTGPQHLGIASKLPTRTIFLFSSRDRSPESTNAQQVTFRLPAAVLDGRRNVRVAKLNRLNSPHRLIREALSDAGLLDSSFEARPERLGSIREMTTSEGERFIGERWDTYTHAWTSSQTLRPLLAQHGSLSVANGTATVKILMPSPAVFVLVFD